VFAHDAAPDPYSAGEGIPDVVTRGDISPNINPTPHTVKARRLKFVTLSKYRTMSEIDSIINIHNQCQTVSVINT